MTGATSYTSGLGYTPIFRIDRAGKGITSNFSDRVLSVTVVLVEGGGGGDQLTIVLDDRDFLIASPATSEDDGEQLTVFLGYAEGGLYSQGTFSAKEVKYSGAPRTMTIEGSSFGFDNFATAPVITSYDGKTLGDILGEIAAATGNSLSVDPGLAQQVIPYLNQNSSSLHLLQELERRYNSLAKFQDGMLSFTDRGSGDTASGTTMGGFVLEPEDFGSWDIVESGRYGFSKVRAQYWDKDRHEPVWIESQTKPYTDSKRPFLIKKGFNSKEEAQAAADAKMAAANRTQRQGNLTLAKGSPSIRAGQPMIIRGMRPGVDGSYIVKTAIHSFDREGGLQTGLEIYDPGTGEDFTQTLPDGDSPTFGSTEDMT